MPKDKELTKPQSVGVPSYLEKYKSEKVADVQIEDMKIPRLTLVQLSGADYDMEKGNFGDIINNISKKSFGKEVTVIIIKPFKNWVKFSDSKKMIGRSNCEGVWEEGDLQGQPMEKDDKWQTLNYNFYCLIYDGGKLSPIPYCLTMTGSGAKEGKNLFTNIGLGNIDGIPCYANKFQMTSVFTENDKGKFHVWKAKKLEEFALEGEFLGAKKARELIEKSNVVVQDENKTDSTNTTTKGAQKF